MRGAPPLDRGGRHRRGRPLLLDLDRRLFLFRQRDGRRRRLGRRLFLDLRLLRLFFRLHRGRFLLDHFLGRRRDVGLLGVRDAVDWRKLKGDDR